MTNTAEFSKNKINNVFMGDKCPEILSPLEKVIKTIQQNVREDSNLREIIEELEEYITDRPDREIIGVEKKLEKGNREDLLSDAVYLKNKFERRLAKKQMSLIEQKIYTHILATINTTFNNKIRPLILENKSKSEIDGVILEEIIQPVYKAIISYDLSITTEHVKGMLYFLTGKCHIIWSK